MRYTTRIACLLLVLLCAAAPASAEETFAPDSLAIEIALSDAFMNAWYGEAWRTMDLQYGGSAPHQARIFFPGKSKPEGTLAASAIVEYQHTDFFNAQVTPQALDGKLNHILNDLYSVQESNPKGPALIDFETLYATSIIGSYAQSAKLAPWRLQDESFSPVGFAIRPFIFRDAQDDVLENRVYMFIYLAAREHDIAWLCADGTVISQLALALTGDPHALYAWRGLTPPHGKVRITSKSNVNVRATAGTDSRILGQARPGEEFDCLGQDADTGWYEIELSPNQIGFISPKMVEFTPM